MVCALYARVVAAATTAVAVVAVMSSAAPAQEPPRGLSLQLHRVPDQGLRAGSYQRRRLARSDVDGAFESVPLNLGMGTHYAWVYVGTPPQRASVITDTGSSLMAFPCSGCHGCGHHTDRPFSAKNSSTLTHVTCENHDHFRCNSCIEQKCRISQSYMEGSSWAATVVEDVVYLGDEASQHNRMMRHQYSTQFKFGCQNSATGLFITQVADGIMGLSFNDNHIVAKLYDEKKIPNKLFTLCFAADGGAMAIGEPDTSRHSSEISYVPVKKTFSHDMFAVAMTDIRVSGTSMGVDESTFDVGEFIVDSGTTDTFLPSAWMTQFQDTFKEVSGFDYMESSSDCVGYTDDDLASLPTIDIVLKGEDDQEVVLVVGPDQYLLKEASNKYCGSIFLSESSGGIFGSNVMLNRDVVFDQGNHRIGFADADCNFHRQMEENRDITDITPEPTTNATASPLPSETPKATLGVESTTPPAPTATPKATLAVESTTPPVTTTPDPNTDMPPEEEVITVTPTTETPSADPSATPSSSPVTSESPRSGTPEPSSSAPASAEEETTAPTTTTPSSTTTPEPSSQTPAVKAGTVTDGKTSAKASDAEEVDHRPVVLTVVGAVLAVGFIVLVAISIRRTKKRRQAQKWSRVNKAEEEDDNDGLIQAGERGEFASDEDEDEDDDFDHDASGGRVTDHVVDDDDEEDEIFDRNVDLGTSSDASSGHEHDTRVLERL